MYIYQLIYYLILFMHNMYAVDLKPGLIVQTIILKGQLALGLHHIKTIAYKNITNNVLLFSK